MSSRCPEALALAALLACGAACAADLRELRELRVCADPDNLPYSSRDGSGFENRIAELVAQDMGAKLTYFWQELRRGFVRKTMGADECDVFIGVPAGFERVLATRPYYRSSYVAIYRAGARNFDGFDPDRLKGQRIGVQLVGDDLAATPPGHALVRAGAVDNVRGFTVYGEGPVTKRMVDALAGGQLDVVYAWGPQGAYFARRAPVALAVTPVHAPAGLAVPFEYGIAMGVRKGDRALRDALDGIIVRHRAEIDAILAEYAVPRADAEGAAR